MIRKTKGIAINYFKYKETSIIARVFTRELGQKSYVINGIRSAKSKSRIAFYQPLSLLDLIVYDKEGSSLNRISETKLYYAFSQIPFDFYRSGIAIFMGEILSKVLQEGYQNEALYDFLEKTILHLDQPNVKPGIFPISFLLQLSYYLGFAPANAEEFYGQMPPEKDLVFRKEKAGALNMLLEDPFVNKKPISIPTKRALMDDVILFFQIHLDNFREIKSVKVLRGLGT